MRKILPRLGNSEALVITREMNIGSEMEVEIQGNASMITPVQVATLLVQLERQAKFAAARDQILTEYDGLFRWLADA